VSTSVLGSDGGPALVEREGAVEQKKRKKGIYPPYPAQGGREKHGNWGEGANPVQCIRSNQGTEPAQVFLEVRVGKYG